MSFLRFRLVSLPEKERERGREKEGGRDEKRI